MNRGSFWKQLGVLTLTACVMAVLIGAQGALSATGEVKSHQKISSLEGNFTGELSNGDKFSTTSVALLGDHDGDGVDDIAVGAILDDDGGADRGAVWVLFLNSDGTVKSHQKISDTEGGFTGVLDANDRFGGSVASLGDHDGDGIGDIVVGAHRDGDGGDRRGAVWVLFLNGDGTVKSHQKISDTDGNFTGTLDNIDLFGVSVASLGDHDGDGIGDIAVGALYDDDGGYGRGAVWLLFLNSDGTVKSHQKISDTEGNFTGALDDGDMFGNAVTSLGDFDGDGIGDLAIGAWGDDDGGNAHGAVWVLCLNNDGTVKSHQKISDTEGNFGGTLEDLDEFGISVASLGDLDCDNIGDLAVGSWLDDDGGPSRGAMWVLFLNADGTVKSHQKISDTEGKFNGVLDDNDVFGISVASLDDLDGDGVTDIVVGAGLDDDGGTDRGAVWVLFLEGPGSTPIGTDIVVEPCDPVTGTNPVTVTFEQVTDAGITDVVTSSTGAEPPPGFKLGNPPTYYLVTTTAWFTGSVEICVDYSTLSFGQEKNLKLFHDEDGQWVDRTVSLDTLSNTLCAEVTSLSTFAIFELNIGSVAGYVTADCAGGGLTGVEIDAYLQGDGELLGSGVTDAGGYYQIDSLEAGDYTVTIVTPLSYAAIDDEIPTTVMAGEVATADFNLICLNIAPTQRSIGFWKHQVAVAAGGNGNGQIDAATLCAYLDLIEMHFNNNIVNEVKVYTPPESGECTDKLEAGKNLLNLKGNVGIAARAKQQFMALLLNVASEKLALWQEISEDGATVSQAITYCDNLIDDPAGDHETAKDICDWINNAQVVPAGVIPAGTPDIAYTPPSEESTVESLGMQQNFPNPFNPTTVIRFDIPDGGGHVIIRIYDVTGRLVRTLVDGVVEAGRHSVEWNGRDSRGLDVSSGIYFCEFRARGFAQTRKMVLMK